MKIVINASYRDIFLDQFAKKKKIVSQLMK